MSAEQFDFLKWLATLFGPAGFVLVVTNCSMAWWCWRREKNHAEERSEWAKAAKSERDERVSQLNTERDGWAKRIEGFRQDIKDAFQNVNGMSKDMADALGRVVDVVTDLRITVAEQKGRARG